MIDHLSAAVRERLAWRSTPEEYEKIRSLWISHSKAEDARDLQGLIDTLSTTCVYEVIPTGQRWEGHDGARAFYTSLLGAFPDVIFNLQHIVIGPQGVIEIARMTGTHRGEWNGMAPTGQKFDLDVIIYFPWNPEEELFDGERVYFDNAQFESRMQS